MKLNSLIPIFLAATGVALATSAFTPATAFLVQSSLTGGTAGNPGGSLWQVNIQNGGDPTIDTFKVDWSVNNPVLSAFSNFKINSLSDTALNLSVTLNNTTNLATSGLTNAGITSMGFGVLESENAGATITNNYTGPTWGVGDGSGNQLNFPGGFKEIDVCIFSQGCAGGSQGSALAAGASDSFTLNITGNFTNGATLAFFPLKFQTSNGSFEPAGQVDVGTTNVEAIPEPLTMLGTTMAFGFGGLFKREYDKKKKREKVTA
jgi:hypothetical protein